MMIFLAVLMLAGCMQVPVAEENTNEKNFTEEVEVPVTSSMTEAEAKVIAETSCIKGGAALGVGSYNPNSKTWWFDANLNATKPGCNPACVVSEETKTAEINWRCTGAILPEETLEESTGVTSESGLKEAFAVKYPTYAQTLSVEVTKEVNGFARGNINFAQGEAGGYFLAKMTNGVWEIVMDGNGTIPCNLSEQGFPADMLTDCAE